MCLWKRIERDHSFPVPQQGLDRFFLRLPVCPHEFVSSPLAVGLCLRIRHCLQQLPRLRPVFLRECLEDRGDLTIPAPLLLTGGMELVQGRPQAEAPIGHREAREREPTVLEVAEEREPTFLTLPLSALTGQDNPLAGDERADDREEGGLVILDACLYVDAVGPPVGDCQMRQIPFPPRVILQLEEHLEPLDRTRRQRRAFAQQILQRPIEVFHGEAPVPPDLRAYDRPLEAAG